MSSLRNRLTGVLPNPVNTDAAAAGLFLTESRPTRPSGLSVGTKPLGSMAGAGMVER